MNLGKFPVFPLKTLCFPGHKIPLKIFEDRYLQMLKDIEEDPCFIISLISSGEEVGRDATPYRVGTLVEIGTIQNQGDFRLIRPQGLHRVYMDSFDRESKPYLQAQCSEYEDDLSEALAIEAGAETDLKQGIADLEKGILKLISVLGPEESRSIRDVMEGLKVELDQENFSLFLCGCLHLPPIYLQRFLESKSLRYRIDNALNLLKQEK